MSTYEIFVYIEIVKFATTASILTVSIISLSSTNAAVLANLYDDYTTATSGGVADGSTFSENGWTFTQGNDNAALTYINDNTADNDNEFGNADASGFGGDQAIFTTLTRMPAVSDEILFDPAAAATRALPANNLVFHPGNSDAATGAALIMTWTADQAYFGVTLDYSIQRGNSAVGNSYLAIGGTATTAANDLDRSFFNRNVSLNGTLTLGDISAGETVVIRIDSNGDPGGDSAYGNFIINTVPEPSSALLLSLASLGFIVRRRRS